jgi:hypothetical protein
MKWKEYERLARSAAQMYFETGVGVVFNPIPKAVTPLLAQIAGVHSAQPYYARVAWTDANGVEGTPSETVELMTEPGTALTVRAIGAPMIARGFNVYVGIIDFVLNKQNKYPLAIDSTWTIPTTWLVDGAAPGNGQSPEYFIRQAEPAGKATA